MNKDELFYQCYLFMSLYVNELEVLNLSLHIIGAC